MRRRDSLPELLAPAGDFRALIAAVEAGCDAVYIGGRRFGARAYAKNFDLDELALAVRYCHLNGVKLYVTVNTLIYDKEMAELVEYAKEFYRLGVDALIITDLGAVSVIKRALPDFELHASTQMSVHNSLGAKEAAELGISRVVLARELSLKNIISATEASPIETEVFVHGALCVSHSGQCLFSSLVGGRSGNRGECAQPCRLPYNEKYPLSLSDLSLASHIPELISSGAASLKIEGRMKSAEYVYTVVSIYRRLLDEKRRATDSEERELRAAFSRGGFTDGYFSGNLQKNMTGIRSENDKNETRALAEREFLPKRHRVYARVSLKLGAAAEMTLFDEKKSVKVTGEEPNPALNAPLSASSVKGRLCKMGNTFLSLEPDDIELIMDDGINLSPAELNALRRNAADAFESTERPLPNVELPMRKEKNTKKLSTALFLNATALSEAIDKSPKLTERFDCTFLPLFEDFKSEVNGIYIPPVITDSELPEIENRLSEARDAGISYALIGNIGHIPLVKEYGFTLIGDYRLNVTNSYSGAVYSSLGIRDIILSPELTLPQARDIGEGIFVYGRIPLMLTERCFIKENFGCDSCSSALLTDRKGISFPIIREYKHRNLILNSAITYVGDKKSELSKYKINKIHFLFTKENSRAILSAIEKFELGLPLGEHTVRRIGGRGAKKK